MVTFVIFCGIGAVAAGLLAGDLSRRRRPAKGRALGNRVDESASRSLIVSPPLHRSVSEYFPPPDDGRPQK